jgi:hypothetical protein
VRPSWHRRVVCSLQVKDIQSQELAVVGIPILLTFFVLLKSDDVEKCGVEPRTGRPADLFATRERTDKLFQR